MAEFPEGRATVDSELMKRWARLFEVRDVVLQALERERVAKVIGSSLEARVEIGAAGETYQLLKQYHDQLRYLFIVSQVDLVEFDEARDLGFHVSSVTRAEGEKCERCWNYSMRVGESKRYPLVCERCVEALTEIEGEQRA